MKNYFSIRWIFLTEDIKSLFRKIFFRKQSSISHAIRDISDNNNKYAISYLENDLIKIETSPIPRHKITTHANPKFQSFLNKNNPMYQENSFYGFKD